MARENRGQSFENNTRSAEFSYNPEKPPPRKDGNLFGWTVFILLLIGFAICCWVFSFYVFGHPEKPFSYAILAKLRKLEAPKRFEITAAPEGEFLDAHQLWEKYNKMTNRELERASEMLLRNYLRNYKLTGDKVPYVIGSFNILDSYELGDANLFSSGVVAVAQATDAPQVLIEHVFTGDKRVIPVLHRMLLTGLNLRFDRTVDLSALVNVSRLKDGRLQFTAIPLLYGSYTTSTGAGTFSLEPPTHLNISAGLPVVSQDRWKKPPKNSSLTGAVPASTRPKAPRRFRVRRCSLCESRGQSRSRRPRFLPSLLRPRFQRTRLFFRRSPLSRPNRRLRWLRRLPARNRQSTPLQPFLSPTPASIATTAGGKWPTYPPGQMPRGRLANVPDMSELASRGVGGERVYLQGSFVVTASGQDRAVLRSQTSLPENPAIGEGKSTTRIIVEFPSGSRPPSEGSTLSRDSRRPFLVTEVRKTSDGQVNVYVREVTRAQ